MILRESRDILLHRSTAELHAMEFALDGLIAEHERLGFLSRAGLPQVCYRLYHICYRPN